MGRAEDIAEHGETKAMELEKEIRVDANILKSLEASEQSNKEQIMTVQYILILRKNKMEMPRNFSGDWRRVFSTM